MQDPDAFIGKIIGGYQLEHIIGRGSTGTVFLGRHTADVNDMVAVKILTPPAHLSQNDLDEFRKRFQREAQILSQLHHPNILTIKGYGEDTATNSPYMIFPFISGGTLASHLAQGPLPLNAVARYASQIAAALDYAHTLGIVHRDIKPANVLIDDHDQVLLADFGIVKLFDTSGSTLTSTGQIIGTPAYMAPEQARGDDVSRATDVYGLGVMLYHLVTGRVPFEANNLIDLALQLATRTPPSPRSLRPDLPEPASAAIMRALAKHPQERFAAAGILAQAFAAGIHGQTLGGDTFLSTLSGSRGTTRAIGIVLMVLVLVALSAVLLMNYRGGTAEHGISQGGSSNISPTATLGGGSTTATVFTTSTSAPGIPTATPNANVTPSGGGNPPPTPQQTIFFGSYDTSVYAVDVNTHNLRWRFKTNGSIFAAPVLDNGVVYVGSFDDHLYALNASDGSVRWEFTTGDQIWSTPAIADGIVVFGSNDHYIYGLQEDSGTLLWKFQTGDHASSPGVISNGRVYIGSQDNYLYCLNLTDGTVLWKFSAKNHVDAQPNVVGNVVYVGSFDDNEYALDATTGAVLWHYTTGGAVESFAPVANDIIYVGSNDGSLYALNALTGTFIWQQTLGGNLHAPVIDGDTLYVGVGDPFVSGSRAFYALRIGDGSTIWEYQNGAAFFARPIVSNATIYEGCDDGALYALSQNTGTVLWHFQTGGFIDAAALSA